VSEAAAERAETPEAGDLASPRRHPRFGRRTTAAEDAARALFEGTVSAPADAAVPGPPPEIAISLSELRQRVAVQAGQLATAMAEAETLNRRLQRMRARAASAETAAARERAARGRHSTETARRLLEHHRTIADLAGRLDAERREAAAGHARIALLEDRLEARVRMDASVSGVITRAREAIVEVRAELARAGERTERLQSELTSERRMRSALERRLEEASTRAQQPAVCTDVATACRRLEQELATRDALEIQAARLIGSLNHHFNAAD
jgi:chromosome segregation ATPase